jgi:hypothetical protein
MKATEEMSELRAAIEAAGASPALTHCTVLAGELAKRLAQMEDALQAIYDYDDGAWAAGKHYKDAVKQGMKSMRTIATDGLRVPEYPQPRSFGRSNPEVRHGGANDGKF